MFYFSWQASYLPNNILHKNIFFCKKIKELQPDPSLLLAYPFFVPLMDLEMLPL